MFIAMQIDALLLMVLATSALVILTEDVSLCFVQRAAVALAGAASFAQAMWLLGIWIPSASGYPWPRVSLDIALAVVAVLRAVAVVTFNYRHERRRHGVLQ